MKRENGFSLVEVLVATALLLLIVTATLSTLTDAIHANEGITLMADMQENLRAAMNYMVRDIVESGEGIPNGGVSIPNTAAAVSNVNRPSPPTKAYTFPPTYTTLPAISPGASQGLQAATPNPAIPGAVVLGQNTDMITIIYADTTLVDGNNHTLNEFPIYLAPVGGKAGCGAGFSYPQGSITATGNSMTLDASCININTGNTGIHTGDMIMFQNAQGNTIQTVTGVAGQTVTFGGADAFKLNLTGKANGTIVNLQNGIASPGGPYPPTTATRVWMITYYIDSNTVPLRPQLTRQVNFNPAQAVGEVIEDLEISYDINDAVATVPAVDAPQPILPDTPNQIRKINLFLAARSETWYSKTKTYFRNNLETEVSIRALSFYQQYK
ncbi:MAG: prepilin-type N-terminal cleavage/methylation domain-containing protein [Candidatus Acidiferrales bacterium]